MIPFSAKRAQNDNLAGKAKKARKSQYMQSVEVLQNTVKQLCASIRGEISDGGDAFSSPTAKRRYAELWLDAREPGTFRRCTALRMEMREKLQKLDSAQSAFVEAARAVADIASTLDGVVNACQLCLNPSEQVLRIERARNFWHMRCVDDTLPLICRFLDARDWRRMALTCRTFHEQCPRMLRRKDRRLSIDFLTCLERTWHCADLRRGRVSGFLQAVFQRKWLINPDDNPGMRYYETQKDTNFGFPSCANVCSVLQKRTGVALCTVDGISLRTFLLTHALLHSGNGAARLRETGRCAFAPWKKGSSLRPDRIQVATCEAWLLHWPEIDKSLRCWDAQAHEYVALLKIVKARRGRYCSPRAQFRAVLRRAIEIADADYVALLSEWDAESVEREVMTPHAAAQYCYSTWRSEDFEFT